MRILIATILFLALGFAAYRPNPVLDSSQVKAKARASHQAVVGLRAGGSHG